MKTVIMLLVLGLGANAFAVQKQCSGDDSDFTAQISQKQLEVSGKSDYAGTYKAGTGTVNGKDGKTYLQYDWGGDEGCSVVLVDSNLLKVKGKGYIKFRCRGEGFQDTKFFCKP